MPVGEAKLLPAIAAALLCGAAYAQPFFMVRSPPAARPLAELVAELESDDALARVAANEALEGPSFTLEDLEGVLAREDLTAEQRYRLRWAALVHFRQEPRAAMGV